MYERGKLRDLFPEAVAAALKAMGLEKQAEIVARDPGKAYEVAKRISEEFFPASKPRSP